jgi:hypothetical protein
MKFYLGAYYLIKLCNTESIDSSRKYLYTCSTCINESLLDGWSLSWVKTTPQEFREASENFSITSDEIQQIQSWTDQKFNEEEIGWLNVFYNLETLEKYKKFFKNISKDVKTFAIYFSEEEKDRLLKELDFEGKTTGSFGLETMLSKQIAETSKEKTIGYDLIGVELSGDFHSFYCHYMAEELENKFKLKINEYGLIEDCKDWTNVVEYMNDDKTGCEPVPWFYVKVKMIG